MSFINKHKTKFIVGTIIISMFALGYNEYQDTLVGDLPLVSKDGNTAISTISYEANSQADFYTYNKNIYYCTKDGIQLINSDGNSLWSDTFNMISPYIAYDAGIVAVCEKNGRTLRIYNQTGKLYGIDTENPIITFSVNVNGYSCVIIQQNDSEYTINVYNSSGEIISDGKYIFDNGVPIATDISNDNKVLAVSLLNINDIKMQSNVLFYYLNKDQAKTVESSDGMFSSFIKEDEVVAIIKFMEDNSLITVSDKEIVCLKVNDESAERSTQKWLIKLKNKIKAIDFPENKYVAVAYGDSFINAEEPEQENTVKWFNLNGERVNTFISNKNITGLYSGINATIVAMGRTFKAIGNKGGSIWEYNAIQDVKKILFVDSTSKILFITPISAEILNINQKVSGVEETTAETTTETTTQLITTTEATTEEITAAKQEPVNNNQVNQQTENNNDKKNIIKDVITAIQNKISQKKTTETSKPNTENINDNQIEKKTETQIIKNKNNTENKQNKPEATEKEPIIEPKTEKEVIKEPIIEPKTEKEVIKEPIIEPKTEKEVIKEPIIEPKTQKEVIKEPVIEPKTQKEIIKESVIEPKTQKEIVKEPIIEPKTQKEIVKEPIIEPKTQKEVVKEPIIEPKTQKEIIKEPIIEPKAEKEIIKEPIIEDKPIIEDGPIIE